MFSPLCPQPMFNYQKTGLIDHGKASPGRKVPMIDLGRDDRADIIKQLLKASEEYGIFQVINHGVPKDLHY
ncbi:hypothetical protein VNO78_33747 [Psophocarpus tetragonolobus]|uniref:Non-haem dioxygenase N-terminal domain-containing protein n=1 Tax=Psophocarpus tetragonolobus TaxID=3891 RepID=A0AAN9RPX4_PSOTE